MCCGALFLHWFWLKFFKHAWLALWLLYMLSNVQWLSITVRGIYFAASSYRPQWSVCIKPLNTYRSSYSTVWQREAGQDKMHFCGTQYVHRYQSTPSRKKDRQNTHTYIPFLYLDSIGTVLRQGHTVTKAVWKHAFSLENLLLLKPCRPKTNPWEFMGDCRSWLYRFYNGDKCIMLFT